MSFNLLHNQLNNSNHMIRPITLEVIYEAVSAMQRHNEEDTILMMYSVINRLSLGVDSDVRIISDYIDDNRVAHSICIPIFENFLNRVQNNNVRNINIHNNDNNIQAAG